MMFRMFFFGVVVMTGALTLLALAGPSLDAGVILILEFVTFLGLLPALMGLFVRPPIEEVGKRIAEREVRYPPH